MKNKIFLFSAFFLACIHQQVFSQISFSVKSYPLNIQVGSLTLSDLNADGVQDIASANFGTGNVSVLLGNGQGGFGNTASYVGKSNHRYIVCLDYNGDGKKDIITSSPSPLSNPNSLAWLAFLNGTGSGTFAAPLGVSLTACGERIMKAADVNSDGNDDIVIAEYRSANLSGSPRVSVITIPNNGGIPNPVHYPLNAFPTDVCVTDLDNDGKKDIAVCIWQTGQVVTLLNNGSGVFGAPNYFTTCANPTGIATGDFNGDGNMDIVTGSSSSFAILLGQGNGSFDPQITYPYLNAEVPGTADFDGDGKTDLAFGSDPFGSEVGITTFDGNGDGTFGTRRFFSSASYVDRIVIADLNADGKPDIVGNQSDKAVVYLNTSSLVTQPDALKKSTLSQALLKAFCREHELFLQCSERFEFKMTDVTGKVILSSELISSNEYRASYQGIKPGIYVITGNTQYTALTRKIVIE